MEEWLSGLKHWFAKSTYVNRIKGSNPFFSEQYVNKTFTNIYVFYLNKFIKNTYNYCTVIDFCCVFYISRKKILGAIQRRRGPNVVGVYGLLQPLSDGFKLLIKETVLPSNSNKFIFIISPIITFVISLMGWAIIPYDKYSVLAEVNVGVLYLFAVSSLEFMEL